MNRTILTAWMMFGLSGVFFLVPAVQNVDWWSIAAAVTWLIGVGLFLWGSRNPN